MTTYRIQLPWTAPPLSMNDRGASAGAVFAKNREIAQIRSDVLRLARHARLPLNVGHAVVQLHYRPRDKRRRDTDNLIATLKPICDALAAGTTKHPGYGLVADDIPQHMAKPEPIIHQPRSRTPELWLEITCSDEPKELPA
ncbi:RusA-like holliday junction resolvase [Rhodococcus phage Mbo4]|uniref:RusA-like holliday junction resolvase n=2 Tax=root TaxID=1 RepID=A0A9E7IEP7_9CAUD|nr:hypothetical protein [Rhodococcus opacus]YP_010755964.1 RusA-like holliday junction resolvase [Rhodococcus phage Mbo4]EKT83059.1 hypothetical protein WSS_A09087 [Rhodococcus opacus M213]URG17549.1 RusA-like holliday junction resolvase [Rhodococcus phage Mbo4]